MQRTIPLLPTLLLVVSFILAATSPNTISTPTSLSAVCAARWLGHRLPRTHLSSRTVHPSQKDLSPAKARLLSRARRDLSALLQVFQCKRALLTDLASLRAKATEVRKCLYNGLPYPRYKQLRAVCLTRSEQLEELRQQKRLCNKRKDKDACFSRRVEPMRRRRREVVAACTVIGWDGDRKGCGSLKEVKELIKEKEERDCGTDLNLDELEKQIETLQNRIGWLQTMANPLASHVPRDK